MVRIRRHSLPLLVAVAAAALAGCGEKYGGRQAVTGTVLYKDRPLDDGLIEFLPVSEDQATKSGAQILAGKYEIPRDKGLTPGRYKVAIYGGDGLSGEGAAEPSARKPGLVPGKERIPPEYNKKSDKIREVTADGPNQFDFDIK
jgi:hypothetical protein